jgi:hypothetical protein
MHKWRFHMQSYFIIAILLIFSASCAPKGKVIPKTEEISSEYRHLESRKKSENAVDKVSIGNSGASFYFDDKLWSLKSESASAIEFSARRFTNAHIFMYNEKISTTEIHKKLIDHYRMKNSQLVESKFLNVNNSVVIYNKINGVINKREVSILSYGFSDDAHTIITHCFIYKSMLRSETEQEIIEFLNGFSAKG